MAMVGEEALDHVHVTCIRLDALGLFQRDARQFQPGWSVIETAPIQVGMHFDEQTIGKEKVRIALDGFVQQLRSLEKVFATIWVVKEIVQSPGPQIKSCALEIGRRRLFDCFLLVRRELCL